jgi:alanyl-tRNA synthetase
MRSSEIRESFLQFFAARGHKVLPSSPLLPKDDPTILFTNAGMNQFKNVFLGLEKRSYSRAATCQKCLRVSGKHNDLETVGRTTKHHTFFEMLGNFSFGEYFKREAIGFAWELVTGVFRLPANKLYATVYEDDEQAFRVWADEVGLPADRIFRFGKKDNFWAMGETGPCGPCSEIHYDLGQDIEAGRPEALIEAGSDRFLELWNLVFMEFDRDETGTLRPLPAPSIDTGMGLERMAAVLQGKRSNFETDLFRPLIEAVAGLAQREYLSDGEDDVSMRIIADHLRAVSFLIGDGVTPANVGRGYVLRRLIRRAYRRGNLLGIDRPFLFELVGRVADVMAGAYPELLASIEYVSKVCLSEEERFCHTLSSGLRYFDQVVAETGKGGARLLPGDKLFKLYDTFGFPLDLSQDLARERGLDVDEAGFASELEAQKQKARLSWKGELRQKEKAAYDSLKDVKTVSCAHGATEVAEATVLALFKDGGEVKALRPGEVGEAVLDETPFYAEAGGQVGDTGTLKGTRFSALVENTHYLMPEVVAHQVRVLSGEIRTGDAADAAVDVQRRQAISNNHTATHLLHAALRHVLGDHVKQAGSLVSPTRLRFDFTHFSHLSREEVIRVEALVNERIREDTPVETRLTSLEEGIREGAMAIFEEKYAERVRLVGIGDFSKELCGGVHVRSTGQIGLFKILSESGVSSGMRRIEAVTGEEAFRYVAGLEDLVAGMERALGASRRDLLAKIERLQTRLDELEKQVKAQSKKILLDSVGAAVSPVNPTVMATKTVKDIPVLVRKVQGLGMAGLREMADSLRQKMGSGIIVLGAVEGDKALLVVSVSRDLAGKVPATALIKEAAPLVGGGGGGRADFAQAGGSRPGELDKALEMVPRVIEKLAA